LNAEKVKAMLPVITAFAEGRPVQFRPLSGHALQQGEWMTINPNTTEFRLVDDCNPDEWRVAPDE